MSDLAEQTCRELAEVERAYVRNREDRGLDIHIRQSLGNEFREISRSQIMESTVAHENNFVLYH